MSGRLIAVVGPSGAGKDSVIAGLAAAEPGLAVIRRVVTRDAAAGGEPIDAVTEAEFRRRQAVGDFALAWGAHGLYYGIPAGALAAGLARGDVLANLSRGVLAEAARRFPLLILSVTAAPETLAARLAARGREGAAGVAARLAREGAALPEGVPVVTLANDGPLAATVAAARAALYPERA